MMQRQPCILTCTCTIIWETISKFVQERFSMEILLLPQSQRPMLLRSLPIKTISALTWQPFRLETIILSLIISLEDVKLVCKLLSIWHPQMDQSLIQIPYIIWTWQKTNTSMLCSRLELFWKSTTRINIFLYMHSVARFQKYKEFKPQMSLIVLLWMVISSIPKFRALQMLFNATEMLLKNVLYLVQVKCKKYWIK